MLEQKLPLTFKLSAELLNLKTIQGQLARQKQYAEAHQVQVKSIQMEDEERDRYMQSRHKKIVAAEATLIQKQANEMNALRKKIETGMNERLKQREIEHNKLLQRYQNVKRELENQQNLERNKVERSFTRPGTASVMGGSRSQANMTQSKMSYQSSS